MDINVYSRAVVRALPKNVLDIIGHDIAANEYTVNYRYDKPERFYHTARHILECVQLANELPDWAKFTNPAEAYFALIMHDCVYDVHTLDKYNVEASAKIAKEYAIERNIKIDLDILEKDILITNHIDIASTQDQQIIADIDMSILASNPVRYFEYAEDIMKEFTIVYSEKQYVAGRIDFLKKMIERAKNHTLFNLMQEKNHAAIGNMTYELTSLQHGLLLPE